MSDLRKVSEGVWIYDGPLDADEANRRMVQLLRESGHEDSADYVERRWAKAKRGPWHRRLMNYLTAEGHSKGGYSATGEIVPKHSPAVKFPKHDPS